MMERRTFMAMLTGGIVVAPFAVEAQQAVSALALAPEGDCSGDPFAEDVVVGVGAEGAGRTKD
jgi:hypothetical protein